MLPLGVGYRFDMILALFSGPIVVVSFLISRFVLRRTTTTAIRSTCLPAAHSGLVAVRMSATSRKRDRPVNLKKDVDVVDDDDEGPRVRLTKKQKREHQRQFAGKWAETSIPDDMLMGLSLGGFLGMEEFDGDANVFTIKNVDAEINDDVGDDYMKIEADGRENKKVKKDSKKKEAKQQIKIAETREQIPAKKKESSIEKNNDQKQNEKGKKETKATKEDGNQDDPMEFDVEAPPGGNQVPNVSKLTRQQKKDLKKQVYNERKANLAISNAAGKQNNKTTTPTTTSTSPTKKTNDDNKKEQKQEVEFRSEGDDGAEEINDVIDNDQEEHLEEIVDMSAWYPYGLHGKIIEALKRMKFTTPTPIQARTLPIAIHFKKDVIGAAETGSGKTLAFGLPIVQTLIELNESGVKFSGLAALILSPTRELALQIVTHLKSIAQFSDIKVSPVVGGISQQKQSPEIVVATPGRLWELIQEGTLYLKNLYELRFLVIDEADRLIERGHFPELDSILSLLPKLRDPEEEVEEKARRPKWQRDLRAQRKNKHNRENFADVIAEQMKEIDDDSNDSVGDQDVHSDDDHDGQDDGEGDDIELDSEEDIIEVGDENESDVDSIEPDGDDDDNDDGVDDPVQSGEEEDDGNSNVSDEAGDENGDEQEEPISTTKAMKRQTFIFSATLTISQEARSKIGDKKKKLLKPSKKFKKQKKQPDEALDRMLELIEFHRKVEIIDLSTKKLTAAKLKETKIICSELEKENYLYYFLARFPGRTIVFVNSIAMIRRLVPILSLLKIPVWPMHAQMQQRQRLKNLERFRELTSSVLIATDVLARGVDIPAVDHVIHFQIPRTTEIYVHRSGRTARAHADGLSVLFVSPKEVQPYQRIAQIMAKNNNVSEDEAVQDFPVDMSYIPSCSNRVKLALKADLLISKSKKSHSRNNWVKKAAEELDLSLDESDKFQLDLEEDTAEVVRARKNRQAEIDTLKAQLDVLLKHPLLPQGTSRKYITSSAVFKTMDLEKAAGTALDALSKEPPPKKGKSKFFKKPKK